VPILELQSIIQQELEQNPTLEQKSKDTVPLEAGEDTGGTINDAEELSFKDEFEVISRMDEESYNYFLQGTEFGPFDAEEDKKKDFLLNLNSFSESLQQHLTDQLMLVNLSEREHKIGELIIGSINEDGYLTQTVEELSSSTGYEVSLIQDVLAIIQDFDPVGVGASDLKECLLLQLIRLGQGEGVVAEIVKKHLDNLAKKHYSEIARSMKISEADVIRAAKVISALDPKPGRRFSAETPQYVVPEIIVEKMENGEYRVMLCNDLLPGLHISKQYKRMLHEEKTANDVKQYIRERMRASMFLIKSIHQRQQTIMRVATEIVKIQKDFFDHGIEHLKPLTMAQLASSLNLHETTVCRCVANKYMQTHLGIFEMKYFFSPGLKTEDGKVVSNKSIKDLIDTIIAEEDVAKPLSDQDIVEILKTRGINVARRTVAKYRIALRILPSHLRKA
jgi:RNA polymerase sigma-54 factor